MSLRAIALLLAAALLGVAALNQPPPADYDVRITTFRVTGADLPLSLLDQPVDADAALYARLADMVRDGTAEIAAHQQATIVPGKEVQLGAMKEFPYPTEYFPVPGTSWLMPQSFEYKNCGSSTIIGIGTDDGQNPPENLTGGISIERIRGDQLSRWPVRLPAMTGDGFLNSPKFLTEKTSLPFAISDAMPHLLSIVREAGETTTEPERYLLSFSRIVQRKRHDPSPSTPASLMRFHAITFRLESAAGRTLLHSHPPGSDSSLLAALRSATKEGTATISHQAAVLVDTDLALPEDPVPADPFAGRLPSAQIEAIEEFPFPTEFSEDLLPQSFEYKNLGRSFEVRVKSAGDAGGALVRINLSHYHAPGMTPMPEVSSPQAPQVYQPNFPGTFLNTMLKVRPGGVYCLGAATLPDYFHRDSPEAPVMEISFLKIAGGNKDSAPASAFMTEYESELISLPAHHAASLNALRNSPSEAQAFLDEAMETGTAHSLTFCRIAGVDAYPSNITFQYEDIAPGKVVWTKDKRLQLRDFTFHNLGTSLEAKPGTSGPGSSVHFAHNIAGLVRPSVEALTQIANGDGVVPEPDRHDSRAVFPLPSAISIIGPAEPCRVPAGHPDADRWQVLVTRRR